MVRKKEKEKKERKKERQAVNKYNTKLEYHKHCVLFRLIGHSETVPNVRPVSNKIYYGVQLA